jgi:hypothetical protein
VRDKHQGAEAGGFRAAEVWRSCWNSSLPPGVAASVLLGCAVVCVRTKRSGYRRQGVLPMLLLRSAACPAVNLRQRATAIQST